MQALLEMPPAYRQACSRHFSSVRAPSQRTYPYSLMEEQLTPNEQMQVRFLLGIPNKYETPVDLV